jgi:hypothetical protein
VVLLVGRWSGSGTGSGSTPPSTRSSGWKVPWCVWPRPGTESRARVPEHVRTVLNRVEDPRYVQRQRVGDGHRVSWDPDGVAGRELAEGFAAQREAFRAKFGREIGPDDPVFFDPDADEPRPLSPEKLDAMWVAAADSMRSAGLDPAYALAAAEVGYIVTEENRHTFSALEVEAYLEAVQRHQAEEDLDEGPDPEDYADLIEETADALRAAISTILAERRAELAHEVIASMLSIPQDEDDDDEVSALGLVVPMVFGVLAAWLSGARADGLPSGPVLEWISRGLGGESAQEAQLISGFIGSPFAPNPTVEEAFDKLGPGLLPAMLNLAAGVVATAGNGDPDWLQRYDPLA